MSPLPVPDDYYRTGNNTLVYMGKYADKKEKKIFLIYI
jgi:hypothetical protein